MKLANIKTSEYPMAELSVLGIAYLKNNQDETERKITFATQHIMQRIQRKLGLCLTRKEQMKVIGESANHYRSLLALSETNCFVRLRAFLNREDNDLKVNDQKAELEWQIQMGMELEYGIKRDKDEFKELPENLFEDMLVAYVSANTANEVFHWLKELLIQTTKTAKEKEARNQRLKLAKGKKADFIRVMHTLSELRYFEKADGQIAAHKDVFNSLGRVVNEDFTRYHNHLNNARNKSLEANLAPFEKMMEVVRERVAS